jgi:hypothetical protein
MGFLFMCGLTNKPSGDTCIDSFDFPGQFLDGLCSDSLLLAKRPDYRLECLQLEPPRGSRIYGKTTLKVKVQETPLLTWKRLQ